MGRLADRRKRARPLRYGLKLSRGKRNLIELNQPVKLPRGTRTRVCATRAYFLNKFSNAVRASMGRAELGVEVSFSTRTRME